QRLGGLHRFTNWPGPMLTDSGGYQAFSLSHLNKIDDNGVTFKSIIDGSPVTLTPESAMRIQNELGADIIMAFDDCPPADSGLGISDSRFGGAARRAASSNPKSEIPNPKSPQYADRLRTANTRTVA